VFLGLSGKQFARPATYDIKKSVWQAIDEEISVIFYGRLGTLWWLKMARMILMWKVYLLAVNKL